MKPLKTYLILNSVFSALSGSIMLAFSGFLNNIFNIQNTYVLPAIGINLISFSVIVWFASTKQLRNRKLVNLICILDLLWVTGSLIIISWRLFDLSQTGYVIIGIVALWIAFLAYGQNKYNR